ncbi:adenylate/guanylate cyclase domain-containing protein [Spirosoma arcticum]
MTNILTGYYWKPRLKQVVFLFMDLNQSTRFAEQLGELTYSALMQDFFYLMGKPIEQTGGEVYQYVGDEIVITWPVVDGFNFNRCITCYQRIWLAVRQREADFLKAYGVLPQFKAGMHTGAAVMAEVGRYKSDIAYHGDSINVAARIMTLSTEQQYNLVITDAMEQLLTPDPAFQIKALGEVVLRGRQHPMHLFAVHQLSTLPTRSCS